VTLRLRLVLAAAAAVAAAVVLASVAVFFIVRNELSGQANTTLQDQAARITDAPGIQYSPTSDPKLFLLHTRGPYHFSDSYFQLVSDNGSVFRPDDPRFSAVSVPVTKRAEQVAGGRLPEYYSDAHIGDQHVRILTKPLQQSPDQPKLAVQVVTSLGGLDHELATIKLWLTLVAVGGIAIAAGAGFVVARAALKPVRDLSETAEHVRATQDLSQRIEVRGHDELSQLATTFNAMLASLDEAARRQRQLVQDASHELRTPLTSLRTNIEVLAADAAMAPEEREQLMRDVVEQVAEMTVLISELTELARGEEQPHALEEVRLDLLTQDAIRRTERNHPDVAIHSDLAQTTLVGTPAALERAVANLLDNAAKWSPPGAEVSVVLRDGELTVRDHGPGISEADRPHVFERFYRATSSRSMPGSGLGLAIVKQVAEAHGGSVVAEPAPGGGTMMRLRLPRSSPGVRRPEPSLTHAS
jgi:two-component system, OmpR family, sensor histidine kinase MprB